MENAKRNPRRWTDGRTVYRNERRKKTATTRRNPNKNVSSARAGRVGPKLPCAGGAKIHFNKRGKKRSNSRGKITKRRRWGRVRGDGNEGSEAGRGATKDESSYNTAVCGLLVTFLLAAWEWRKH